MKITNFSFTLRQATTKDGYGDNYYMNIDENGTANIRHPYKNIDHKEQAAILGIIQSAIVKYGMLVKECDNVNQALKLEEYAPKVSAEETTEVSAVPQPSHGTRSNNLDCTDLVAHSEAEQERLDMEKELKEEVSTGADGDIDKPKPTIVITKVTEEDNW